MPTTMVRGGVLATLTLVGACGGPGRGPDTLIGGVRATTDLQAATGLPRGSVHTVVRAAGGWRVLYDAAAGHPRDIAARLCRLEGRAPDAIRNERVAGGEQLPGARKITITCRG